MNRGQHVFLYTLRAIIWLLPIFVMGWILVLNLAPLGSVNMTYQQGKTKDYISGFTNPVHYGEVFRDLDTSWRSILSDVPSFFVRPWRPFKEIDVAFSLLDPTAPLSLTAIGQAGIGQLTKTIFLPEVEGYRNWNVLQDGDDILLQRENHFTTLEDFRKNLPPANEVSTFTDINFGHPITEESEVNTGTHNLPYPLRGTHIFNVYVSQQHQFLHMKVRKYDLNEEVGPDRLTAFVYDRDHTLLFAQTISDDGDETESRGSKTPQELAITLDDLVPGEYRVELVASDEVIIQSLNSENQLVYIKKRLRPFADEEHPARVSVRGQVVKLINTSQQVETFILNDEQHTLGPDEVFRTFTDKKENIVVLKTSQLFIHSVDGFALSGFVYYPNPYGFPILLRSEADERGVNYIYAQYVLPEKVSANVFRFHATYPTRDLFFTDNGYKLTIEFEEHQETTPAVGPVQVVFRSDPLTIKDAASLLKNWASSAVAGMR